MCICILWANKNDDDDDELSSFADLVSSRFSRALSREFSLLHSGSKQRENVYPQWKVEAADPCFGVVFAWRCSEGENYGELRKRPWSGDLPPPPVGGGEVPKNEWKVKSSEGGISPSVEFPPASFLTTTPSVRYKFTSTKNRHPYQGLVSGMRMGPTLRPSITPIIILFIAVECTILNFLYWY